MTAQFAAMDCRLVAKGFGAYWHSPIRVRVGGDEAVCADRGDSGEPFTIELPERVRHLGHLDDCRIAVRRAFLDAVGFD